MFMQLSKFSATKIDIISIYRSNKCNEKEFVENLKSLVSANKPTVIIGDFNFCTEEKRLNSISSALSSLDFKQIVSEATHIEGGHLDQIYVRGVENAEVELYSPYYTAKDHDALCLAVKLDLR